MPFNPRNPKSLALRTHAQTSGWSLTAQDVFNNVGRTCLEAMAATQGHTQSLHTNSLDEALALPTAEAATLALRTQQILAHENGVTREPDPFEELAGPGVDLPTVEPAPLESEAHVADHVALGEQGVLLEHEPDAPAVRGERGEVLALPAHHPRLGRHQPVREFTGEQERHADDNAEGEERDGFHG